MSTKLQKAEAVMVGGALVVLALGWVVSQFVGA